MTSEERSGGSSTTVYSRKRSSTSTVKHESTSTPPASYCAGSVTQIGAGKSAAMIGKSTARRLTRCSRHYRIWRYLRRSFFGLVLLVYVLVPLFYRHCTWIRRSIIYMNALRPFPEGGSLEDPVGLGGFPCARNFYLKSNSGDVTLGAWHVMPKSLVEDRCNKDGSIKDIGVNEFNDKRPVVLHLHGSAGSRGSPNRIRLIDILTNKTVDAHVLTLDYRGFADSTPARPTVESVTDDVVAVYRWLRDKKKVDNERIFLYGQSLGTGISVHLAFEVQEKVIIGEDGNPLKLGSPAGLILEAPYTDIAEASSQHPYTFLHTYFPLKTLCFVEPIKHPDTFWDSRSRIGNLTAPVLILHAEDDETIPYNIGKKLYDEARTVRDPKLQPTRMSSYTADQGYGHNYICRDPGYPVLINNYIEEFSSRGR